MKPAQRIQAARYGLMKQRPYLATATIRLRMVASEACPHALAASEGWVLYYNPALVEQTELETLVIQLRREVERLIRRHARRLKSFPREVAEIASAMEIDDDLAGEYGESQDWTLPQSLGFEPGRTAEEYAVRLLDLLEQQPPSVSESGGRDGGKDGDSGACAGAGAPESGESGNAGANNTLSQSADGGAGADNASSGCPADSSHHADASSGCPADSSHQQDGGTSASPSAQAAQAGDASAHGDSAAAQAGDAASHAPASPPAGSAASGRHAPWETDTDEEPISEVETNQLIETTLQLAAEYAKTRGAQGVNMARRYEAASNKRPLRWQQILARYIARGRVYGMGRLDYSYARPHRRQSVVPDVVLPTLRQPLLNVAVVVDTSSSISDDELGLALREVQAILKRGGIAEMRVVFGDTRIHAEARVRTAAEAIKAFRQVRGGGGTDMGAVVRDVVETSRPQPDLIVVITDGETPWGNPPRAQIPVIAVITPYGRRNNTPAWVKEVTIDE